jgi:hypothetical protein
MHLDQRHLGDNAEKQLRPPAYAFALMMIGEQDRTA